jgi:hypothetical protein
MGLAVSLARLLGNIDTSTTKVTDLCCRLPYIDTLLVERGTKATTKETCRVISQNLEDSLCLR